MTVGTWLLALSLWALTETGDTPLVKPAALEIGDTIGLVAPASSLAKSAVDKAVERLRRKGYAVKMAVGGKTRGYLAADDEFRAAELNGFFADPDIKAILCVRGGYGTPRILDKIDYDLIRRNPKILVGYSDITALLNSIQRRTGLVVFHGPMAKELGSSGWTSFTSEHFWGAFTRTTPEEWGTTARRGSLRTICGGVAEGPLVGGNLSVISCTVGTPYAPRTEGAILFLEDVKERPFRIDRMLNHLRLAGKLAELHGVLLGSFTDCQAIGSDSLSLEQVFRDYLVDLGVPVLAGFPAGHQADHATLPLGLSVRLDATAKRLFLLEAPVAGTK